VRTPTITLCLSSVACPRWSVAVSTIRCQSVRSLAFLQANWIPMLTDCRSVTIAVSQLVREHAPQGLLLTERSKQCPNDPMLASTTLTLFCFGPLRKKTSPNSRRHRTSLPVLLNLAVHVLSSSSSIGSPSNTALTSKRPTTPYIGLLFILPNRLTYVHPCMPVFPLVPSDSPTLIFSVLFVRTAFGARSSALQPLQEAQLSPRDRAMRRVS